MNFVERFRQRNQGASVAKILWWSLVGRPFSYFVVWALSRYRGWGMNNIPLTGPVLLVANHQSFLDPPLIGGPLWARHFHSMARSTLFNDRIFGWLIRSFNTFPVDQGKGDVKAIRTAIARLKEGQLVLVFPEGERCIDGQMAEFQDGIMLLVKRAKPIIVPVGIDGSFDVWPRHRKWPRLGGLAGIEYGQPIAAERLLEMKTSDATTFLYERVEELQMRVRSRLRHASNGVWPPSGVDDEDSKNRK